jgi:hypothetical protein
MKAMIRIDNKDVLRISQAALFTILLGTTGGIIGTSANDVSGQWTLRMLPDFRGSRHVVNCAFTQQGQRVTVECGDEGAKMWGKVQGNRITFRGPSLPDNSRVFASFTGDVNRSGTAIKGKWHLVLTFGSKDGKWAATKR